MAEHGFCPACPADLAALCPNCHRMIHRAGLMSVEAVAAHVNRIRAPYPMAAEPAPVSWANAEGE